MPWQRMIFRNDPVWVHVDDNGRPVLDRDGRAEMKYRESDTKTYRPGPANLTPDPTAGPPRDLHGNAGDPAAPGATAKKPRRGGAPVLDGDALQIWTDGACSGNPGPGGWGAILKFGDAEKELKGGEAHTTNNRMELMAAISALEALKKPCSVDLYTDSQYVRQGITGWIHGWKKNGWRTADRKPVKNVDLWQRLDAALKTHDVRWHWVKGHAGHAENERADQLSRDGLAENRGR